MLHTASGFHTFTVFKSLSEQETVRLLKDFKKYRRETGRTEISPTDDIKKSYRVYYPNENKGIHWLIRLCTEQRGFNSYTISATINPKILGGITDYISAAAQEDLLAAEEAFNLDARKISRVLGRFSSFQPNRIDYCINFDLKELGIECSPEQMISLIKSSNIPPHFKERMVYDSSSHRMKSDESSFYLMSNSVTINCYYKHVQLHRNFPDCPNIEDSHNVIRFEVQCKYIKTYHMKHKLMKNPYELTGCITRDMLSDDISRKIINDYFRRIIMRGDYYTLQGAKDKVKAHSFRKSKESRLVWALTLINESRGISNAKEKLSDNEQEDFIKAMRELEDIGVNPVTIPKSWGIAKISGLLESYNTE